eukprot:gene15352-21439_t
MRLAVILGDTIDSAPIAPHAAGADLLSHEATFMTGLEETAIISQHSTGYLAGAFANAIMARHLVLTHFSARYKFSDENAFPVADEEEEQQAAIRMLMREARGHFSTGTIHAARDFYTYHVPPRIFA